MMSQRNRCILLADDDIEDQELFIESVTFVDPLFQVKAVTNGREALDFLSGCEDGQLPSLIVLDYNMPEVNGPAVLESLSRDPRLEAIPALVWSTSSAEEFVRECIQKGAAQYFVKPSNMAQLQAMVQEMLTLHPSSR